MKAPRMAAYYTPDEVAECFDRISPDTYVRLWSLMGTMKETKPLGGDGSDGTVEWPEPTEEKHSLLAIWDQLTEDEQREITVAFERMDEEDEEFWDGDDTHGGGR